MLERCLFPRNRVARLRLVNVVYSHLHVDGVIRKLLTSSGPLDGQRHGSHIELSTTYQKPPS